MMVLQRLATIAFVVGIAVTARGEPVHLDPAEIQALTPVDTLPDTEHLDFVFDNQTLENLRTIALAPRDTVDLGIQLRAIRTLASYCPEAAPCGLGTTTHDTLIALLEVYQHITDTPGEMPTPKDVLRLRATIETLGIAGRSAGVNEDVDLLLPYLLHQSRDIRATTARALGNLCNTQAIVTLRNSLQNEPTAQVRLAISAALRDLGTGQCPD